MNEKASPGVKVPEITSEPAYHTMPTMLKAPSTSMMALESSSILMSLRARSSIRLLSLSQRACSKLSRPKALTILAPVKDSCRSTKSSAMRSWVRRLIRYNWRPSAQTASARAGNVMMAMRASTGLRANITTSTATIVPDRRTVSTTR